MNVTSKDVIQFLAIGFLGVSGLIWLWKGDSTNAAWSLGALAGYAFKNGVLKHE